mgnify:CR=1 FL=1
MRFGKYWQIYLLSSVLPVAAVASQATMESTGSFTRVVIPVKAKSKFSVREDASRVILHFEQNPDPAEVKASSDERVKDLRLLQAGQSTQEVGITLAHEGLDYFAYYQPTPPAVIVDVWPKQVAKTEAAEARMPATAKKSAPKAKAVAKISVKPLDRKGDFFYQIPFVTPDFEFSGESFDTTKERDIGRGWTWTKPDLNLPGGTNFSLAQKLFERKQYALCIKTIEFARRDFPTGEYSDEMDFLEALAYREMGLGEKNQSLISKAEEKLQELMLRESKSGGYLPFASKIRIYFASEAYRSQRWLDAISHFEFITTAKNAEKEQDYSGIVMAMAEAYFRLHQYRRAERIYRSLSGKDSGKTMVEEAAYRLGNIHADERALSKADKAFRSALREFPKHESKRVEAYFNLAESNFGLGEFAKAEEYFKKFIDLHPSNTLSRLELVR